MKTVLRFLVKWLMIFVAVSIIIFAIARLMPTSPVDELLTAYQLPDTPENVAVLEHEWGLDRPLPEQYLAWITNFVKGDWGQSMIARVDIRTEFMAKLPYTLTLGIGGMLIGATAAFFVGYAIALKPHGFWDRCSRALTILAQSVPSFIFAMVVIYLVGVQFRLVRFFTGDGVVGLLIATLIIALYMMGNISRVVAVHFREQMNRPYVRFAIARGFSPRYVLLRHCYRPVLYGLLAMLIAKVPLAIGGSSIMEFSFSIPGISYFLVESMQAKDYYVLQSYVLVIVILMFFVHLILNLLMKMLDAREA